MGSFVASSFAYYYYIRFYLDFNLLFFSQALRELLVAGDCYFFFCSFVVYMFVTEKKHLCENIKNRKYKNMYNVYNV